MGKYIKKFETHSQYEEYMGEGDVALPNVSYCKDNDEVHYNPFVDARLVVTYNVEDASSPTQLYYYSTQAQALGVDMFDKVEIDGNEVSVADLDTNNGSYQLSVGEHTVAYTLKDPTSIGVTPIDESTFKVDAVFIKCNAITNVTIPNSVTSIGNYAFQDCYSLTSVTIGDGVTSIGEGAFAGCGNLTRVEIDSNTIMSRTYTYEENLKNAFGTQVTEYIIGNSVTSIGNHAFQGCNSLTSVTIGDGVTSIGEGAFAGCGVTSVTIPNSVTSIGNHAFQDCYSLTSVTIPNSVTSIGEGAFTGCGNLTSVTIGNGVTSIGNHAFQDCYITSVTIPNSVTSIGECAFCSDFLDAASKDVIRNINQDALCGCKMA